MTVDVGEPSVGQEKDEDKSSGPGWFLLKKIVLGNFERKDGLGV